MMRRVVILAFALFVLALPFGARYVSDVAALLLIVVALGVAWRRFDVAHLLGVYERRWALGSLFAFLFFVTLSIAFASSKTAAIFAAGHLLIAIAAGVAVAYLLGQGLVSLDLVFGTIAFGAVTQSIIGFLQFASQSSVGLVILGESMLSPSAPGVAKIVVEGVRFVRAYGTFPHPNVLAAFLLVGIVALAYFFFKERTQMAHFVVAPHKISLSVLTSTPRSILLALLELHPFSYVLSHFPLFFFTAGHFFLLIGLLLTFSRSAWIIFIFLFAAIFWWAFRQLTLREYAKRYVLVVCASALLLLSIFYPFIFARASLALDEPAVADRIQYARLGLRLVAERPLGVGIGNQVLFAREHGLYSMFGLVQPWQQEPIHNLYLLMASELGIGGFIAFCVLIGGLFLVESRKLKVESFFVTSMLIALLLFGFTDHFLWDIQQGRLLLWFVVGLLFA